MRLFYLLFPPSVLRRFSSPGTLALWAALDARDASALALALDQGPSLNAPSPRWRQSPGQVRHTALFEAVACRWVEGVQLLLGHGAQPWATGSGGDSAVEKAFEDIDEGPGVRLMWDAMLAVPEVCTRTNAHGKTLLHMVCEQSLCSTSALRRVLHHPQDINALDGAGMSALAYLAQKPWNFSAIESLIEHGGDPFLKGPGGVSAEDASRACGHPGLHGQMLAWWRSKTLDASLPAQQKLTLASGRSRL